ncbi:GAF domain-containing protein [Beggiatoa alba B18LD]|uniref:GAF domain-containing protein n=2 Tax=Beggiatoa alba TaxID=1022 RepID=I3CEC9_9GAMM|nr:GAF domain-containing protein [Beggiatoa alba B18LD]
MKIATKLALPILSFVALGVFSLLFLIAQENNSLTNQRAQRYTEAITHQYASFVKAELEMPFSEVRTLATLLESTLRTSNITNYRPILDTHLKGYIEKNQTVFAIYVALTNNPFKESSAEFVDNNGYFKAYWTRNATGAGVMETVGNKLQESYQLIQSSEQEQILSPHLISTQTKQDIRVISFLVPLLNPQKKLIGLVGVDVQTDSLSYLNNIRVANLSDALFEVYADDSTVVISYDKSHVGQSVNAISYDEQILTGITKAKPFFHQRQINQIDYIGYGVPIRLGVSKNTWLVIVDIPRRLAIATEQGLTQWSFVFGGVLLLGLALLLILLLSYYITKPLQHLCRYLQHLASGQLNQKQDYPYHGHDEIGDLLDTVRRLQIGLYRVIQQTNAISVGDYHCQIELLSNNDQLGLALSNMTTMLRQANEKNLLQDWLKTGQAQLNEQMSGEQDKYLLAKKVITFLTRYLDMQVGTFYGLIPREVTTLKLLASSAYHQRKTIANEFLLGEGIIGQAALEGRPIIITDIPEDYMLIRSGLGNTTPRVLLVFPILYENHLKGVIELGSFHTLEPRCIEFLNQSLPNIAVALNTTENNQRMQNFFMELPPTSTT